MAACLYLMAAASLAGVVSASPLSIKSSPLVKRDALPDYAITYAPYSYLYSGEGYWPSDISVHLQHMNVEQDFNNTLTNTTLETLNTVNASSYLTSNDDVTTNPDWLVSLDNRPDNTTGYSAAPATIIVADKGDFVDVFYFHFYSNNFGLESVSLVCCSRKTLTVSQHRRPNVWQPRR